MKKIFTCISLAAATFMATTPVMAQQQKLTDKEKAAVIEAIVPAMFERKTSKRNRYHRIGKAQH